VLLNDEADRTVLHQPADITLDVLSGTA